MIKVRLAMTGIILLALWLLMSGIYKPLVIFFGVASVLLAVFVVRRMDSVDGDHLEVRLKPIAFLGYIGWLLVEIAKSNWAVTRMILSRSMPMRQHLFRAPYSQSSELGQVVFANSITLTPGTISVEVEEGEFLVHALDYADDTLDGLAEMDARVSRTETS